MNLMRVSRKYSEPHESSNMILLLVCTHIFIIFFTKEQVNIFKPMHGVEEELPTKQVFHEVALKVTNS